ncbi:MAG: excinuclease ABC subunit UvrC [Candidatus Nanoarchaeia archaeon]
MIDYNLLPQKPGCYIYKNRKGNVVYVGKAKNLKKRVASYFTKGNLDSKTSAMLKNAAGLDYIITSNEVEALVLENSLIKKHQPRYNIILKDSKRYAYLRLTDEKFPRLVVARQKKGQTFGPFVSAQERDYILATLKKIFRLRTCKKMPKRACLRYHINLCDAPCIGNISQTEYDKKLRNVKKILKGKIELVLKDLEKEMKKASINLFYEKAIEHRNQLQALQYLKERQNMERSRKYDEDIINYVLYHNQVYLVVFNVYKGTLANKQEFVFEYKPDFLSEFMLQLYEEKPPKEIIMPEKPDPKLPQYLSKKRGSRVTITIPKKGEKRQLLELAKKNAEITFFGQVEKTESLGKKLKIGTPGVIEIFDISHLSGTSTVASMVQFRQGRPDKNNYRRFKIRTVDGVDDYKAIAEVVNRRYKRLKNENSEMPDLIIIDGGKGQLKAALYELEKLNLKIPLISIAKKEEEIFLPHSRHSLKLDKKDKALKFVQEMRDEAHRFAIKYNRLLRSKINR